MFVIFVGYKPAMAQTKKQNQLSPAEWLIGKWQNKTTRGTVSETWLKVNDSTFTGKSYFLRGADTLSTETIRLEQRNAKLYYVPTVNNQNGGLPVKFAATAITPTQMIFENPEHDFPQKITYTQITRDSLVAEISGTSKGQPRSVKFPMARVK
ncbi:hypothetical protein GCM10023149_00830 [Mucilaginibacter gynuensis]|uniref:DUF6265 domain-containing protein n=2 Tax=Mucilaginibacter gynuensis TaxID=1302236 RepID=A0ABP8FN10_9SPHI